MQIKNLLVIIALTAILTCTALGQGGKSRNRAQSIQSPRDVASGQSTGNRRIKPTTPNNAHDKYANQEVGYRQTNKRRNGMKNQAIEVENDETHRTQTARTETVNNNESRSRKRIDTTSSVTNLGDTATHEVGHKGKRRTGQTNRTRNPQETNPSYLKIEGIDGESIRRTQPNGAKYDGIDGESNDARRRNPSRKQSGSRRKAQNLLPYVEQDNLKTTPGVKNR